MASGDVVAGRHRASTSDTDKRMRLRYAGTCRLCDAHLPAREPAIYERSSRTVRCIDCWASGPAQPPAAAEAAAPPAAQDVEPSDVASGSAGASARREHERRRSNHEKRLRERWGRLGGLAVALSSEPQSTAAWSRGAVGEERVGRMLDDLVDRGVLALHDRQVPESRANIDHLAVTAAGVWVIDAKRYTGRPRLSVEGGVIRPRVEKLYVGSRNCTRLVDSVLKQAGLVRDVVGDQVPVHAALCFVDADWPLIGGDFVTRDVRVAWPRRLSAALTSDAGAPIDQHDVRRRLAEVFIPA